MASRLQAMEDCTAAAADHGDEAKLVSPNENGTKEKSSVPFFIVRVISIDPGTRGPHSKPDHELLRQRFV
jgi:hypothetical protein